MVCILSSPVPPHPPPPLPSRPFASLSVQRYWRRMCHARHTFRRLHVPPPPLLPSRFLLFTGQSLAAKPCIQSKSLQFRAVNCLSETLTPVSESVTKIGAMQRFYPRSLRSGAPWTQKIRSPSLRIQTHQQFPLSIRDVRIPLHAPSTAIFLLILFHPAVEYRPLC